MAAHMDLPTGLDEQIIFALKTLRPKLICSIKNVKDILDHMHHMLPTADYIKYIVRNQKRNQPCSNNGGLDQGLEQMIINCLGSGTKTAIEIAKFIGFARKDVNSVLYSLKKRNVVISNTDVRARPVWSLSLSGRDCNREGYAAGAGSPEESGQGETIPQDNLCRLLDGLESSRANDFWVFVKVLFKHEIRQGHLCVELLSKYESHGGIIPPEIQSLVDVHYCQELVQNPPTPTQLSQPMTPEPQQETSPESSLKWPVINLRPNVPTPGCPSDEVENAGAQAASAGMGADSRSAYQQHKDMDIKSVYRMESLPRGKILIINNIDFVHFDKRTDAELDCKALAELFGNLLGFIVTVKVNCTGKEMREEIERFSLEMSGRQDLDSCSVAIMTHGCAGDVLFGTDGYLTPQGAPRPDTYILSKDLKHIFSSSQCPGMREKPKLFIIQACRGNLMDSRAGLSSYGPHVPVVNIQSPPSQTQAVVAHNAFIYATVEDYVAYRHVFINLLVEVFMKDADKHHIKDLTTTLTRRMLSHVLDNHLFTVPEETSILPCSWFLNPPRRGLKSLESQNL